MQLSVKKLYRSRSSMEQSPNAEARPKPTINLRTILKSRNNHKELITMQPKTNKTFQNVHKDENNYEDQDDLDKSENRSQVQVWQSGNKPIQFSDKKIHASKSLDVRNFETLPEVNVRSKPINANVFKKLSSITPQSSDQYHQLMEKLDQLDKEAEELIKKKILKLSKKSSLITLRTKGKDEISLEIQKLVSKVKKLQSDGLENKTINPIEIKVFMDKKIKLLQKLLAENQTESEVLKKYFFAISAINQQNKSALSLDRNLNMTTPVNKRVSLNVKKTYDLQRKQAESISSQSSNQIEYLSPKPEEYQTYRYKAKEYAANNQPFPRSSYKREFLVNPKMINFNCKNMDNHTIFGKSRLISSTYNQDFQRVKTEVVDYKELDSYRNKIKNIQINYNFNDKREESQKYAEKSRKYIEEQLKMRYNTKIPKLPVELPLSSSTVTNSHALKTENQRMFTGGTQIELSTIKDKELSNLKYSYKTLINN